MKKENNSLPSATVFARPFRLRRDMSPKGFSDELTDIREAVINKTMSVGEAKIALLSLQIELNHAALEMEYMKLDHDKALVWRMPLLDRQAEKELNGN